jgi:hypothetical protein
MFRPVPTALSGDIRRAAQQVGWQIQLPLIREFGDDYWTRGWKEQFKSQFNRIYEKTQRFTPIRKLT